LTYRRTTNNVDLIVEKLKTYKNDFDVKLLIEISKKCSIATIRTLGIILDLADINSDNLYEIIKNNKNHSFMTSKSDVFNAKWRIYIDKHFDK